MGKLTLTHDAALYLRNIVDMWKNNKKARRKLVLLALPPVIIGSGWIMFFILMMRFRQSQGGILSPSTKKTETSAWSLIQSEDPVGYVLWSAPNNIFSQMLGLYMAVFVSTALNRTLIIPSSGFSISEQDCGEEMNPEELVPRSRISLSPSQTFDVIADKEELSSWIGSFTWDKSIDLLALQNMTGLRSITDAAFSKKVGSSKMYQTGDIIQLLKGSGSLVDFSGKHVFYIPIQNASDNTAAGEQQGKSTSVELTGYEKISVASKYLYFGCITSKSQVIFTDHRKALGQALRKSFRITYTGLQNAAEKISVRLGGAKSYWSIHLSDQDLSSTERIKKAVDWTISHIVSNAHGFNQTSHARKTMSHRERLFWCKEGSTNNHSGSNADGYEKGPIIFLSMAKALVTIPKRLEDAFPCLFTLRQLGDDISRKESQKEEDATDSRREQTSKHGVSGEEGGEMSRYDEQLLELLVALSSAKVIGKPQDAFLRLAKELK